MGWRCPIHQRFAWPETLFSLGRVAIRNMTVFSGPRGGWHSAVLTQNGICQFVLCDGSVTSLSPTVNAELLGYLAVRNDGEVVHVDQLDE